MKEAKEYLNDFQVEDFKHENLVSAIVRVIQQTQKDAIIATVNECSFNVETGLDSKIDLNTIYDVYSITAKMFYKFNIK